MDTLYSVFLKKIGEHDYEQVIELNEAFKLLPQSKIDLIYGLIEKCTLEIEDIKSEAEVKSYVN